MQQPPQSPNRSVRRSVLYFHSGGHANTLEGDGRLSWEAAKREQPDHYTYVPEDPVTPAPVFNSNSNTGNPVATDTQSRPAEQTIFHDGSTGSYVDLPVMPNQ
jgi:hypothetical protein